ncbi:MAG: TonB-dependent receptor [Rhodospirillaceae bacterium]
MAYSSRRPRPAAPAVALRAFAFATTLLAGWTAPAAEASFGELEEIVVTALKRETLLSATPLAVTALSGRFLEEIAAGDFNDYFRRVPGLATVDRGSGAKRYLIRGVSTIETGQSQATVAQYLDEVPITDNFDRQPDPRLADVERVEVLRGPQGTLFGARSMAGTVRTITRKPELGAFGGRAAMTVSHTRYGDLNTSAEASLNVPAGETLALRGVVYYTFSDGYVDNAFPGGRFAATPGQVPPGVPVPPPVTLAAVNQPNFNSLESQGGRLAMRWQPTDRTTLDLMGLAQKNQVAAPPFYGVTETGDGAAGPKISLSTGRSNRDILNLAALTLTQDLDWAQVTAVGSYAERDNFSASGAQLAGPLGSPALGGTQSSGATTSNWTGEVRAASASEGPLQWIVGVYGFEQRRTGESLMQIGFGAVTVSDQLFKSATKEYAGFGELSYEFADAFTATAGVRYSSYENRLNRFYIVPPPGTPAGAEANPPFFEENNTTLKFQVSYAPSDDLLTYVLASQGFRPGGFNPNSQPGFNNVPRTFESDSLWNYELGVKATVMERLRVNGALYRIDWKDMQVQGFTPSPTGPNVLVYATNASGSRIVGLELEASMPVTDRLSLDLSFNHFFQNELSQNAPVNPNGLAPTKGDPLSFNPITSFNAGAEYRAPVMGLESFVRADWSYAGRRFTGFRSTLQTGALNPLFNRLPPYHLVSLRAGVADGPWRVQLSIENLTDARPVLVQENNQQGIASTRVTARPRTVGLNVSVAY